LPIEATDRRWRRVILGLAAALVACLAPACHRPRPIQARPALFVVQDADTTIWLFGTIHVLPANVDWRGPAIDAAIARADMLVTEVPPAQLREGAAIFTAHILANGLPPALTRVAPSRRAALLRALDATDMTLAEADRMKSWAIATTIGSGEARLHNADRAHGAEAMLARAFRGRPQAGLESLDGQLALFDRIPEIEQRAMLTSAIDALDNPKQGYGATLRDWARGDLTHVAASFNGQFDGQPAVRRVLITDRNRRWTAWIAQRMAEPGRVLVAVGAGHLAGPQSVIALLAARGLKVRRVQ